MIGLGSAAHHVTVVVCESVRASNVDAKATLDSQPARLDNLTLTTGHEMVGTEKVYCVLSATALDVFRGAAIE